MRHMCDPSDGRRYRQRSTPKHGMWAISAAWSAANNCYTLIINYDQHPEYTYCGLIYDLDITVPKINAIIGLAAGTHIDCYIQLSYSDNAYSARIILSTTPPTTPCIKIGEVDIQADGRPSITMLTDGTPIRAGDYYYV